MSTKQADPNDPKVVEFFKRVAGLNPPTCYCHCGVSWRSHCYTNYDNGERYTYLKCPGCGSHSNIRKVAHDPEEFTIG